MPNPFFFGGRIENPNYFVGRERETRVIFSALETFSSGQAQHVSITGERRIGKSSLLYNVTKLAQLKLHHYNRYQLIYIDLDDARNHTQSGLFHFILNRAGVRTSTSIPMTLDKFSDSIERLHDSGNICLVLCIDELEHLAKRQNEFPNEVYEAFRSLGSNNKVSFVTASKAPLSELISRSHMTSTFPNIFTSLRLGEFTDTEASELIERGLTCDRPFTNRECQKLLHLAGNHPARLQIAGRLLYDTRSNPPREINWDEFERDYKSSLPLEIQKNYKTRKVQPDRRNLWLSIPEKLGRTLFEFRGQDKPSQSSSQILGWIIILLIISIVTITISLLFGWVRLDSLKEIWRFFFPVKQ